MMVCSRCNFHWFGFYVHSNVFKLKHHCFKLFINQVWVEVAYIKVDSTMFGSSSFHDFIVDWPCNNVTGSKFHTVIVSAHEPFTFAVDESSAFSPYRFSYKNSLSWIRIDHTCWVELYLFHINQVCSNIPCKCKSIPILLGCIWGYREQLTGSTSCKNNSFSLEIDDVIVLEVKSNCTDHFWEDVVWVILDKCCNHHFINGLDATLDDFFLKCSHDFMAGSVSLETGSSIGLTTKWPLVQFTGFLSVKEGAILFQVTESVRWFID